MTHFDDKSLGETVHYDGSLEAGGGGESMIGDALTSSDLEPGFLASLRRFEARMDKTLGIESHAIDRKTADQKRPVKWYEELTMAFIWASGTLNISCFSTGFLSWEFGLNLKQSLLIIIFACFTGGAVSAYCATFGAAMGLRQIFVSRYSFGWYPNKLIALLNGIEQLGWTAVACISGGLALTAVADGHISLIIGVVIIATVSLVISFLGLGYILMYGRYAWILNLTIYMIIFGMVGPYADNTTPSLVKGTDLSGNMLSLFAIIYGSSSSWRTIVSDFYVHYPADVSRLKVFALTILGIAVPTSIGMSAGAMVASALNTQPSWKAAYTNPHEGLGFLIRDMLHPRVFAKIVLVHGCAISFQQMARPLAKIPRFIWTIMCFAVVLALAVAGRQKLNIYLQDFLSLLGYWCTSYFVILMLEHTLFRKRDFANYDLDGWNDPSRLPIGIAASVAFLLGAVAWCMGMVESWFVGPIGGLIGEFGGDLANELAFVVTFIAYIPARYLELKYFRR
ncbi:permease for cytosine/purines, uracil, thiamine, allantoin domain-containing protein [Trichoderma camerunense]